ncbi:RlmE family RNA methyltransferase [Emcibacter sp. SYSU 3D8]|uniref:RlmE family RNA methyltransferase n=1 Tax=Emcibacter sp. SYSU 3D8 TaxID=3133969 RepID=UPI0031FF0EBE
MAPRPPRGSRPSAPGKSPAKGSGERELSVRVKSASGRTLSSTLWLQRQLNDPYVAAARREGYRSRAAYKLIEMDEKYHLLKKGARIIDLGAAPGGWSQVAVKKVGPSGRIIAIDINEFEPIPGVEITQLDFLDPDAPDRLVEMAGGPVDLVMSDMAAPASGHRATDHIKIMALCEAAIEFAVNVLAPGGSFVAKVLKGGTENELLVMMQQHFRSVRHAKPKASRQDSAEAYVVATGFKGLK